MNTVIDLVLKRHRWIFCLILLLTVPFAYFAAQHRFFNHIDVFFDEDDPDLVYYKNFQERYGNEEMAVIVFKQADIFTPENIAVIQQISSAVAETPGIQRVFSLALHETARGRNDTIYHEKLIPGGAITQKEAERIRQQALSDEVIVNSLVSPDGTTTAIAIELKPIRDNIEKRDVLIDVMTRARAIAAAKKGGEPIELKFAGVPYVEVEMNHLSQKDFLTFIPLVFVIIFIFACLLLREIALALLCQVNLFLCLIWAVGFFVMCGETFNMATIVIGPVILAISVADSIHLLAHFRKIHGSDIDGHVPAVSAAAKSLWLPCLFTTLTTGVGFFSFITGAIRPVKALGVFTAAGVLFAFILTMAFLPSALVLFTRIIEKEERRASRKTIAARGKDHIAIILTNIGDFTYSRRKSITALMIGIFIVSFAGMTMIRFETNFMNYLPDDSEIRKDIAFIEKNLGGTIPFVMLIHAADEARGFNTAGGVALIDTIQRGLMKNIGQFTTSFSIADYFKEMNQAFGGDSKDRYRVPASDSEVADYHEIGDPEVLRRLVSPDRLEARISFQSRWDSNETANDAHGIIVKYMTENLGSGYTYKITGLSSLYLDMEYNLKKSQRNSFILAFVIIFAMMHLVCRNIKLTAIAMTANIFPIAMTMGTMGWFGIPLDVSTVMIASVTIGIAVDDTIHFVTWYRRGLGRGMDAAGAAGYALREAGRPIIITSVVLFLGFFVLVLGTIKPTQAFGMLTALAMLFALVGDLVILPALISLLKPGAD